MKRRRWLNVLIAVGMQSLQQAVLAQRSPGALKIGYLHPRTIAPDHPTLAILRAAWIKLGYVEGGSVLLRSAGDDLSRVPALMSELAGLGAGVVIVVGAAAVKAAARATRTTPIVAIDLESDPVRAGYAASFARPGGNVTGLFLDQPSIAGKWIDLLREAAPDLERLVILWDAGTGQEQLEIAKAVSRAKGYEALVLELGAIRDFDVALRPFAGRPRAGIVQLTSPGFVVRAADFAAAARKHRIPAVSFLKAYAQAGVLMTYGPVQEVYFGRAVGLADQILKGAKPGDIPIEAPDRFELVINRDSAKQLGLVIPQALLLRADEILP